jgi:hypothetical protein
MKKTSKEICLHIVEWCRYRIKTAPLNDDDARALCSEFYEWLEPEGETLEIYSLDSK